MDTKLEPLQARDIILLLELHFNHDWRKILDCIHNKNTDLLDSEDIRIIAEVELFKLLYDGYKVLVIIDEDYPKSILNSPCPPFVIYYKGDTKTVEQRYFDTYNAPGKFAERMCKGVFLE